MSPITRLCQSLRVGSCPHHEHPRLQLILDSIRKQKLACLKNTPIRVYHFKQVRLRELKYAQVIPRAKITERLPHFSTFTSTFGIPEFEKRTRRVMAFGQIRRAFQQLWCILCTDSLPQSCPCSNVFIIYFNCILAKDN